MGELFSRLNNDEIIQNKILSSNYELPKPNWCDKSQWVLIYWVIKNISRPEILKIKTTKILMKSGHNNTINFYFMSEQKQGFAFLSFFWLFQLVPRTSFETQLSSHFKFISNLSSITPQLNLWWYQQIRERKRSN